MSTATLFSQAVGSTDKAGRRRFRPEFKRQVVELTLAPGASVAAIAMAHQLNANQLFKWRRQFLRQQGRPQPTPELLPVEISSAPEPAPRVGTIEVELAGARVRITGQPDPGVIRTVLASLRAR
jgi:transposase